MANYFIKEETLTEIADQTRGLLGHADPIQGSAISGQLNTANNEVAAQELALTTLLAKINNLPERDNNSFSTSLPVASGTVVSNSNGEVIFSKTPFEPKQMMVWNVQEIEFDECSGHDGVMLCAIKMESGHWVAHYMGSSSGTYYIAQASVERGPFQGNPGYGATNIYETADSIVWALGGESNEDGVTDFSNVTLNYVLIG